MSENENNHNNNGNGHNGNGNGNLPVERHYPYDIQGYGPNPYDLYPMQPPTHPMDLDLMFHQRKHIREYYRLVMKRKWVILSCIAIALTLATIYSLRQIPIYQATAKLEIDQESENILPYQSVNQQSNYYYDYQEFLQTQIKHLTSRTFSARAAVAAGFDKEIPVKADPPQRWAFLMSLLPGRTAPKETKHALTREERIHQGAELILGGLKVTPVRNSRVVEVSYSSPDAKLAAQVVNTVIREYIEYNFQAKYDANTRATDFLQKQLIDLKAKVEQSDASMIEYARTHSITSVGEKQDVVTQTLADLNSKLTEARTARMEKESVYRTMAKATPENFPQGLRTDLIRKLEEQLVMDEQDLARLKSQLGPSMPQVKQIEAKVSQERSQLLREKRLALENSDNEYKTALARENLLFDAYNAQKRQADQLNEYNIHYSILKREVETNKQLYDGLLQRMKEAGVATGLKSSNIRIVDQAETPTAPISNDLKMNLYMAFVIGLFAGLGMAFLLNYMDNNVKTPEDVEEQIGLPALGLVPSLQSSVGRYGYYYHRNSRKKTQSLALTQKGVELASLVAGNSPIAEAYRGLRTALLLSMPNNPPRTIMVTSCKAGEGKTTTVCNTAISLAQAGKKVLIIDADMRRPKIRRIFNGNGNAGLSEYLTGQVEFDELVQETNIPNVYVAYAGAYPPNPGELLGSSRMKEALTAAVGVFDFVLVDTPPMMSVTDPVIVAPMTDGVIMVIKGGKNSPDIIRRARKNLELVRSRIIGVLCNNVDLMHSDYHHYLKQYADYSAYVSEESAVRTTNLN